MSEQPNVPEVSGVLKAICAVASDLSNEGVGKHRKNTQQGYNFRGIDDIYQVLSPLLVKHGLVVIPDVEVRNETQREAKSGGALYSVCVRIRFRLMAVSDGSSTDAVVWGEAMDSADKATNKAMSAAYKYFAFMTFCIPVEGSDDADFETPQPRAQPRQVPSEKPKDAPPFASLEEAMEAIKSATNMLKLAAVAERMGSSKSLSDFERDTARNAWLDKKAQLATTK